MNKPLIVSKVYLRLLAMVAALALCVSATAQAQVIPYPGDLPAEPVTVPGPGERLIPIEGSEAIQDPIARVQLVISSWLNDEGHPRLEWRGGSVSGGDVLVVVDAAGLEALSDFEFELLQQAVSGAVHSVYPFETLYFEGETDEGLRLTEEELRPRVAPLLEDAELPEESSTWTPADGLFGGILPLVTGEGALAGRRVALSPGHGLTWMGSSWATQRSDSYGLIEDYLTATIAHYHTDPYLRAQGADVVWLRDLSFSTIPSEVVSVDSPEYSEQGEFVDNSTAGGYMGSYRWATASNTSAVASWRTSHTDGEIPVFAWWLKGTNRSEATRFTLGDPSLGIETERDQQRGGEHWHYLGTISGSGDRMVRMMGATGLAGVMIADSIRFGSATGGIIRNGQPSGVAGWMENGRNYAEFSGAPSSVYAARNTERDSDIVARPLWANRLDVDAYVSIHTNAAGGTGTETFIHNSSPTAGSSNLRAAVHEQLISDIRAHWNPDWTDRGVKQQSLGELSNLTNAPGILTEIAFHDRNPDTGPDVPSLHDPKFRRISGRAVARGVVRYFSSTAAFVPEPPRDLMLRNSASGLELSWSDNGAREGASAATAYVVYVARGDGPFDGGTRVTSSPWTVPNTSAGDLVHVRVSGVNTGGVGLQSRVVSAVRGDGEADLVLVDAYRRWDRETTEAGNDPKQSRSAAAAIAAARDADGEWWSFDGITRERWAALADAPWDSVVWLAGRDSPATHALSADEAAILRAHVEDGGALLFSGGHAAGLLAEHERQWLNAYVGASITSAASGSLQGAGALAAENSPHHYALKERDNWTTAGSPAGQVSWSGGQVAGAWWTSPGRFALLSAPLECIESRGASADLAAEILTALGALGEDGEGPGDADPDPDPVEEDESDATADDPDTDAGSDASDHEDTDSGDDSSDAAQSDTGDDSGQDATGDDSSSGGDDDVREDQDDDRRDASGIDRRDVHGPSARASYTWATAERGEVGGCATAPTHGRSPAGVVMVLALLGFIRRRAR